MSRRIEGKELLNLSTIIEEARREAEKSTCGKDHRGVVVFKGSQILGRASNGPLPPYECQKEKCFDVCGIYAMHAERLAIINALEEKHNLNGASVLHVRIDEKGVIQASGMLRCEDCSGFMSKAVRKGIGLEEFILLQADGLIAYGIHEADEITRKNLGLI